MKKSERLYDSDDEEVDDERNFEDESLSAAIRYQVSNFLFIA